MPTDGDQSEFHSVSFVKLNFRSPFAFLNEHGVDEALTFFM